MMRNSVFAGHSSLTNFFCTESHFALWTYSWKKIGEKRENKKFKKLEKTLFTKPAQRVSQKGTISVHYVILKIKKGVIYVSD